VVLTVLVVLTALLVCGFLFEGRYTRKAHITGYLVPDRGVLRLVPPQAGVVTESHVVEGRSVKRDDVLFVLSIDRASLSGDTQTQVQNSIAARKTSLHDAQRHATQLQQEQVAGLDRQLADMKRELAQMDAEANLFEEQLALKRQDLAQYESLRGENFVSEAHVRTKKSEVLDVQAKLQVLSLKRSAQTREMGIIEARRRQEPLRTRRTYGKNSQETAHSSKQRSISSHDSGSDGQRCGACIDRNQPRYCEQRD